MLAAAGLALFAYTWRALGFPLVPKAETEVWTVEVTVSFDAGPGPIKANLYIPGLTPGFAILEENFVSRGFGFTTNYVSGGRQVQWARRRGCPLVLLSDSVRENMPRVWWKEAYKRFVIRGCHSAFVAGTPQARYAARLGDD